MESLGMLLHFAFEFSVGLTGKCLFGVTLFSSFALTTFLSAIACHEPPYPRKLKQELHLM